MPTEKESRQRIDERLQQSGWIIQDSQEANLSESTGVAVREYPTGIRRVDYALFVDRKLVGVIEAKRDEEGYNITAAKRKAESYVKNLKGDVRFVYIATGILIKFTDYKDINNSFRNVFSFHRPETLNEWLKDKDTKRNYIKRIPPLTERGDLRDCQFRAIKNLEKSFAEGKTKALLHMATGSGKTFTAITAIYRLLKYGKFRRILFLVDRIFLGKQAESSLRRYRPPKEGDITLAKLCPISLLSGSNIPKIKPIICVSGIKRIYSILQRIPISESEDDKCLYEEEKGEEGGKEKIKGIEYNSEYPPEFFDLIIVDECHRSIYGQWKGILEYFDAHIIGLTATPDDRALQFFERNLVIEYSTEQAVLDGIKVDADVWLIETKIGRDGAFIKKQKMEFQDRLTKEKRWKMMDEDLNYTITNLGREVENLTTIEVVIDEFKKNIKSYFAAE